MQQLPSRHVPYAVAALIAIVPSRSDSVRGLALSREAGGRAYTEPKRADERAYGRNEGPDKGPAPGPTPALRITGSTCAQRGTPVYSATAHSAVPSMR